MRRWMKVRADRRRWAAAQTLPELADLMALWLEGELSMWPGYADGAAEETAALIPALAAANRAGFLTDASQPGCEGPGFDGLHWQQRAAVTGLVADERLLTRIRRAGEAAGLLVLISHPRLLPQGRGVVCTVRGGQPYTVFGEYLPPRDLRHIWPGISSLAADALCDAWQLALIDPEIGRNDRLWPLLDEVAATEPTPEGVA
ncbi:DUF6919 domain-containing protein [Streptomyces griseofuscus]|uniref:DUF6919 domain-containing protein n=1 Tax=Streptomyces griseofuscus TaxID=146922 RepID=UPI00340FAE3A